MTDPKGRGKTCEPDVKAIVERLEECAKFFDSDYGYNRAKDCREAAATIERLTAERDKWRDAWMTCAHDEAEAYRERDEALERAENAEQRVKELKRFKHQLTIAASIYQDRAEAAEKLAKELEVGIKRLSDEEELLAETTDGDMFSMVSLAAKLAASERRIKELEEGRDLDKVVLDEGIEIINELESSNKLLSERVAVLENERDVLAYKLDQAVNTVQPQIINRAVRAERIINNLNPEEALDDSLLRDIHLRLVIHGEKYPDRMVSVLHRNVVFYTITAAIQSALEGK